MQDCSPLSWPSLDGNGFTLEAGKPFRRYEPEFRACHCNGEAYNLNSYICTHICSDENIFTCVCKNFLYSGDQCDAKICKHNGSLYCQGKTYGPSCGKYLNMEGYPYWEPCSCNFGSLISGSCRCDPGYGGEFCDTRVSLETATEKPKLSTAYLIFLPLFGMGLILASCAYRFMLYHKQSLKHGTQRTDPENINLTGQASRPRFIFSDAVREDRTSPTSTRNFYEAFVSSPAGRNSYMTSSAVQPRNDDAYSERPSTHISGEEHCPSYQESLPPRYEDAVKNSESYSYDQK